MKYIEVYSPDRQRRSDPLPRTGPAALDRRTSLRRIAVLAGPWLLAALLAAAAFGTRVVADRAASGPTVVATPSSAPSEPTAAPTDGPTHGPTDAPTPATTPATLPPADRLGVLEAARRALGTAGLPAGDGHRPDRWPLETVLVDVVAVTDQLHVATVHALVITAQDGGWSDPSTAAVAVPLVRTTNGFAVAGPAWPLPAPTPPSPVRPDARAVDQPDPALVEVLLELGWQVDEVEAAQLVGGAVLALQVHGTPPDGGPAGTHVVWLLDAPGGPRPIPTPSTPMPQEAP